MPEDGTDDIEDSQRTDQEGLGRNNVSCERARDNEWERDAGPEGDSLKDRNNRFDEHR